MLRNFRLGTLCQNTLLQFYIHFTDPFLQWLRIKSKYLYEDEAGGKIYSAQHSDKFWLALSISLPPKGQ